MAETELAKAVGQRYLGFKITRHLYGHEKLIRNNACKCKLICCYSSECYRDKCAQISCHCLQNIKTEKPVPCSIYWRHVEYFLFILKIMWVKNSIAPKFLGWPLI